MSTLQQGDDAAAAVAVAPRVTLASIEAKIAREEYAVFGDVLTVCVLHTVNGFTVTGESACASPENFNAELGQKFARERAIAKLWGFEGYLLREQLHAGVVPDHALARISHEVNRAWCAFNGDLSQPAWDDAPDWQKSSATNGVAFHRANPGAGDSASHDSWMAEKVAAGWVYGEVKNPDASPPTHPCIVPFDQLPRDQQFKDRLFRTVVHAGLAA
jgi:hypothetical protein